MLKGKEAAVPRPKATEGLDLKEVLPRLRRRRFWPAKLLAKELGWGGRTVYKYVLEGKFERTEDGISTASVVKVLRGR